MKSIAVFSIKGGVGKTSTAVNLAWYLAKKGERSSLIDLDPQCACRQMLPIIEGKMKGTSLGQWKKYSKNEKRDQYAYYLEKNLSFFQGDQSFRKLETTLEPGEKGKFQLQELISSPDKKVKFQIIDCPAGLGRLSEALLQFADNILVPLTPSELSLRTLEQLYDFMDQKKINQSKLTTFFNRVSYRKKLHQKFIRATPLPLEKRMPFYIPVASAVESMSDKRMPCTAAIRKTKLLLAYELLFDEVLRHALA